jgi:potassium voltage-gated channel Eag-related subfamily H protein 8
MTLFCSLIEFKKARAKARLTINTSKRGTWQCFVSSINRQTPITKVWQKIKTLSGKATTPHVPAVKNANGDMVYSVPDIANTIGNALEFNSSTGRYDASFQVHKARAESKAVSFSNTTDEIYNCHFSMADLEDAIRRCRSSTPGPDDIHNDMLTHLSNRGKNDLLAMYNSIWSSDDFPHSWREAFVIPIPKPHKDHTDPNNHRPIALTSCLCKLFERMFCSRLRWFLETNNLPDF